MFRLTFNKPAAVRWFDEIDAKGLMIKAENGVLRMKAVASAEGEDVAPLEQRFRGGAEAVIEGTKSVTLKEHLKNPYGSHFFILKPIQRGWIGVEPYIPPENNKFADPPRQQPNVRVWTKGPSSEVVTRFALEMGDKNVPGFVEELREARDVVKYFNERKFRGRPSRELADAREKLMMFSELVREILPKDRLIKAYDAIGAFLYDPFDDFINDEED